MPDRKIRPRVAAAMGASLAVALGVPTVAGAANVQNGGFETGSLSGWQEVNEAGSAGSWDVYSGSLSPISAHPVPSPPEGSFAAITDQMDVSSNVLYQNVKLAKNERHLFSAILYYTSYATINGPLSLDYMTPNNQQYRVDIMKTSSSVWSVSPGDIYKTVFATPSSSSTTMSPTLVSANLTKFAGDNVRVRFAQVDNENYFNAGVDAVMIVSTPIVKTRAATAVKAHKAELRGFVNPNGGLTTYDFQYGTTKHYGHTTTLLSAGTGTSAVPVSAHITGLKSGVTYHYRLFGSNAAAQSHSRDRTFTTP